jgi:hypothetical protein
LGNEKVVSLNQNRRRNLSAALLLAALPLAASAAERPGMVSTFGFGGISAPGRWNPLRIACKGALEGGLVEITRRDEEASVLSVESFEYAAGAVIECPVFLDDELGSLSVGLRAGGELLAEEKLALRSRSFPGHIVLVSGVGSATQASLGRILLPREPVQVVAVKLTELPSHGLDYDGLAALVLRDPGVALSPPRIEALRSWLGAGGALALVRAGEGRGSLASAILPADARGFSDLDIGGGRIPVSLARFGAGRIALVSGDPENLAPVEADAFWDALIDLPPFERSERFVAGLAAPPLSNLPFHLAAVETKDLRALAFYAPCAALFLVLAFAKRRRRAIFVLALVAASAAAFVVAPLFDRSGKRDARAAIRALVLPGASSLVANLSLRGAYYQQGELLSPFLARRVVDVGVGEGESGRLFGTSPPRWSHGGSLAFVGLRETRYDELSLSALLPSERLDPGGLADLLGILRDAGPGASLPALTPDAKAAFLEAGGRGWRTWNGRNASWDKAEEAPFWLVLDAPWLAGLSSSHPSQGFFVGLASASPFGFSVMGDPVEDLVWAYPFSRAGEE